MDARPACLRANNAYQLTVSLVGRQVVVSVRDLASQAELAGLPYLYRAVRTTAEGQSVAVGLQEPHLSLESDTITIAGTIAGLELTHRLALPQDRAHLEETISLRNPGAAPVELADFACALRHRTTNSVGRVLPELQADRLVAVPLRHRATDPDDWDNDFDLATLSSLSGRELRVTGLACIEHGYLPGPRWHSEGWAWSHGAHTLAILKFSQEGMELSGVCVETEEQGAALCFGGCAMRNGDPWYLRSIAPGQTVSAGLTRLVTVVGGHTEACYALRDLLAEKGCGLPEGFDPPVHWNELYDNPEWHVATAGSPRPPRRTRQVTYTRDLLLLEAAKARDYHCEALYLDPGWDTALGSFVWGQQWLGDRKAFIDEVRRTYGLQVALHCPLATWASWQGDAVPEWPQDARLRDRDGSLVRVPAWNGAEADLLCLGSRQYLDAAEARLLASCDDGAAFLMFDGNWWPGACWDPSHGHPVPYTFEDHCRANLNLAQRVHRRHPEVLIEMHDMITGGSARRYTPLYYKYGLPGSYDDNWGFELMWQPMEDLRSGRARSLYDYNLGCEVPAYLHVDLRTDNEHCLVLWWYASTCRHLGIGGTHEDGRIAAAQREAMARYRRLDAFYKRGRFYGLGEEVHVHALPAQSAFVVNLFNLSDESRIISATVSLEQMGVDADLWYISPLGGEFDRDARAFHVSRRLAPWSAQVAEVLPVGASYVAGSR